MQWLQLLNIRRKNIYHAIYTKGFYYGTVSYPKVYSNDVINTNNNDTAFTELRRVFEEYFEIKFQEGYSLKYLNFPNFQSPLGLRVYQTDHITEVVNEWFPTGKIRKDDTPFSTDSTLKRN